MVHVVYDFTKFEVWLLSSLAQVLYLKACVALQELGSAINELTNKFSALRSLHMQYYGWS